jgi:hypothetical protein
VYLRTTNHRHGPDSGLPPAAGQAAFSIAFDKLDTVFAVLIREIPKIHRQAASEPPGSRGTYYRRGARRPGLFHDL